MPGFVLSLGALLGLMLVMFTNHAEARGDCPELTGGNIRWIVPSRPGGGYDAYSRLIQPFLEDRLHAHIIIENQADAGGVVGAIVLRDAVPDGRTLGIVNASGLIAANAVEEHLAPDPLVDFTVLAQVVSNHMFMFTGRDSTLHNINDVLQISQSRPIVVGVRDLGSTSFYAVPVVGDLLGMDYVLVGGYVGNPARILAVMRGEVDIVLAHFDSVEGQVQAGELIPLLSLAGSMEGVTGMPQLGGPDGLARQRAGFTGRTPQAAEQMADELATIVGAGRLVAGPPGMPKPLATCLESTLGVILQSEQFLAAARRARLGIEYANATLAAERLAAGSKSVEQFRDLISAAVAQARE